MGISGARNNPNPRKEIIVFSDIRSADEERKKVREEWKWYKKAARVLEKKPRLRKQIKQIMNELETRYESIVTAAR